MTAEGQKRKRGFRLNLSTAILIGLTLGILCGVFFGQRCAWLGIVGQVYIGLLQMSILPYMMVSLIGGIGSLSSVKAIRLALTAGLVLLASWLLAFAFVFLMPLAFPAIEAGSFFSPSLTEVKGFDFIGLYVPVNPFRSMAQTVVPAVAIFSVVVGIALIGIEGDKKQGVLQVLDVVSTALTRVAVMVVRLAPFGIFAIAAHASGTMTLQELGRLQVYIGTFVLATLVLTFVIMPGIVAVTTPFSYRDVLRASRAALITGFVTGNLFIVLPLLIENGKQLFEDRGMRTDDTDSFIEVLIPVSFNFPNLGKLLTLLFVLFAGWYTGNNVSVADYPMFSIMGLLSLFGGVDLALPFLLNEMRIPSDMYQLYVVTADRLAHRSLSDSYMTVTAGLVVDDYRRNEYNSWDEIRAARGLRLAVLGTRISRRLHEELPNAEVTLLDSPQEFFDPKTPPADALLMTAEGGSAYTILYPQFDVAIPEPYIHGHLAFVLPTGDRKMAEFISAWIHLKETDRTIEGLRDKWIMGRGAEETAPRWCIVRDVLHWAD